MSKEKQFVKYSAVSFPNALTQINADPVGTSAYVVPVDHPDTANVANGLGAWTSTVVSYDETTGIFETQNTVYSPE